MAFTDVTFLLDRSGSMESKREFVVKGINDFIANVKSMPGQGCWSLVQFDDRDSARGAGEAFPHLTYGQRAESDVPAFGLDDYKPRGGTALVDAVCMTILSIKERVASLPQNLRDERKVMLVIVTDGEENQSRDYTNERLRELRAEMEAKHGWEFMFLGAGQEAFLQAQNHGLLKAMNFAGLNQLSGASSDIPVAQNAAGYAESFTSGSVGVAAWRNHHNNPQGVPDELVARVTALAPEPVTGGNP